MIGIRYRVLTRDIYRNLEPQAKSSGTEIYCVLSSLDEPGPKPSPLLFALTSELRSFAARLRISRLRSFQRFFAGLYHQPASA